MQTFSSVSPVYSFHLHHLDDNSIIGTNIIMALIKTLIISLSIFLMTNVLGICSVNKAQETEPAPVGQTVILNPDDQNLNEEPFAPDEIYNQ